jgi:hypothetical protein
MEYLVQETKLVIDNIQPNIHSTATSIFFQLHLILQAFGTNSLVTRIHTVQPPWSLILILQGWLVGNMEMRTP